ncbi:MAG TPA: hypothetical protein VGK09_13280 [Rhodocyclaceae bacterium]|jgi:hypothetical protein
MTSHNNNTDATTSSQAVPVAVEAWKSGFDYAFGFQIKMMMTAFGINTDKKD